MKTSVRGGEIEITLRDRGRRAFLIVETGTRARAQELVEHLGGTFREVRPLLVGPVVACVVRTEGDSGEPLDAVAEYLRGRYSLAICEPGFAPSMCRVAAQLARDTEAEWLPLERCDICGADEPFPSIVRWRHPDGEGATRFCTHCLEQMPREPEALCRAMLARVAPPLPWRDLHLAATEEDGSVLRYLLGPRERIAAAAGSAR